jgi:hypothetical protein
MGGGRQNYVFRNELELTYSDVQIQIFSRTEPPDPCLKRKRGEGKEIDGESREGEDREGEEKYKII